MPTISVYGSMYEFNYIEISDEDIKRLLDAKESGEDLWEDLEDIHDEIMGDSIINGFAYKIGDPKPEVFVDGDQIDIDCETTETENTYKPRTMRAHYLVFEQWSKGGSMELETENEVDPTELFFSIDQANLPNGEIRKVLDISYSEGEFEFQGSRPAYQGLYIMKSDGTRIDL